MISFTCSQCSRAFSVPESFAGRRAKCKNCGNPLTVPAPEPAPPPAPPQPEAPPEPEAAPKIPLRVRRLISDSKQMAEAFNHFRPIRIRSVAGNPPDVYRVEYAVRGLERGQADEPVLRNSHLVEINLTADYPRVAPHCKMLTPIFHPNIDAATICVGDHWTAGERLPALVIRIGEMIAYQAYNIKSPLDAEAAMWADLNTDRLPIDPQNLHPAHL